MIQPGSRIIVHNTGFKDLDGSAGRILKVFPEGRVAALVQGRQQVLEFRQVRRRWWWFW